MPSKIFLKNIIIIHVTKINCILTSANETCFRKEIITIGVISKGLAWWVPYVGQKLL